MEANRKRYLQISVAVVLAIVLLRTGYIFYQRSQAERDTAKETPQRELQSDDFVFLRSLHAYDLASAKKLEGMTVWIKAGNAVAYFRPGQTEKEAGLLPPLARIKVSKVARQGGEILATFTFESGGPPGAFVAPIGAVKGENTNLILDELFYYDDPHQLYSHWSTEIWDAIKRHEIVQGMSENQAGMAMGLGRALGTGGDIGDRTLQYQHDDRTVEVLFVGNRAARIQQQSNPDQPPSEPNTQAPQ